MCKLVFGLLKSFCATFGKGYEEEPRVGVLLNITFKDNIVDESKATKEPNTK